MRNQTVLALAIASTLSFAATGAIADSVDFGASGTPTHITTDSSTPQAPKPNTTSANTEIPQAKDVGESIGEGAATATKTVGEGATAVGHGVRDTTKAIGHGTRDFFHGIGNGFRKIF